MELDLQEVTGGLSKGFLGIILYGYGMRLSLLWQEIHSSSGLVVGVVCEGEFWQ